MVIAVEISFNTVYCFLTSITTHFIVSSSLIYDYAVLNHNMAVEALWTILVS